MAQSPHAFRNRRVRTSEFDARVDNDQENGVTGTKLRKTLAFFNNRRLDKSLIAVEELMDEQERDVMSMTARQKIALRLLPITQTVAAFFSCWALALQARIIHEQFSRSVRIRSLYLSSLLLAGQTIALIPELIGAIGRLGAVRGRWRPRLRLRGDNVPSVDVIIPCCHEDMNIILDTIRAVRGLDYPKHRYRVIITDDGSSPQLKKSVAQFALEAPAIHYVSRSETGADDYKAGNLNYAVRQLRMLPEGPAELVASLDADMIPEKSWLRALVPHLLLDEKLGLVYPPQHFYNQPRNDPLYQSLRVFYRSAEILKDMCDFAFCTGTGWVMRHKTLQDIGLFPTSSLTEDIYTSVLVLAAGWKTAYVPEALQYGLMAETYYGHIKQVTRWNLGNSQIAVQMRFGISSPAIGMLSLNQRLMGFSQSLTLFAPVLQMVGLVVLPVFLCMGISFLPVQDDLQLKRILRVKCLAVLTHWVLDIHSSVTIGRQISCRESCNTIWMAPYHTVTAIRAFLLPNSLGGKVSTFVPTGTIRDALQERHKRNRAPLAQRLKHILIECGAIFHLAYILICVIGVSSCLYNSAMRHRNNPQHLWKDLVLTLGWPPAMWYQYIIACLTPLQYACLPPNVPDREASLDRDSKTGVAYPTREAKQQTFTAKELRYSQLQLLLVIHAAGFLIGTWWM